MDDRPKNFYANAVNIVGSLYDVTMVFRSQSPQLDDLGKPLILNNQPALNVSDEMVVRMSPQHAKSLAALLIQQVILYEKQFNLKLPLPPELEKLWTEYTK